MSLTNMAIGAAEKAAGNLLNTQTTNLGSSVSKLTSLMNPKQAAALAPSIFAAGPQDKLIVQDIYGVTQGNPINNVNLLTASSNQNVIGAFAAASGGIGNLSGLLSVTPAGVQLNASVLTSRISTAISVFGGSGTQVGAGLVASALGMKGLGSNQFPVISTNIGGVVGSINTQNVGNVQGLISAINGVTGNPSIASYMDVGASSALMSAVMREAITAGVPGVVPALIANSTNSQVMTNALTANVGYAVQNADISTINTAATALGPGVILGQVPNAVPQVLAGYKIPAGSTTNDYGNLCTELLGCLNTINPGWDKINRNGTQMSNLSPFVNMSADARTVFASQGQYTTEMAIASSYPSTGLVSQAKQQYPYMVVQPTSYTNVGRATDQPWITNAA